MRLSALSFVTIFTISSLLELCGADSLSRGGRRGAGYRDHAHYRGTSPASGEEDELPECCSDRSGVMLPLLGTVSRSRYVA